MLDTVCDSHEVQDAKADRRDPCQCKDARSRLETYARRAVTMWRNDVQAAIVAQDGLGMGRTTLHTPAPETRMERVLGFMRTAAEHRMQPFDDVLSDTITNTYSRGFKKGHTELGADTSGLSLVRARYGIYQTLIRTERKGIIETSIQAAARVLAESATNGETPARLHARMVKKVFNEIALKRLITMTTTMVTAAYNAGKIDAYERIGLTEVEVIPETVPNYQLNDAKARPRSSRQTYVTVLTAGDDRVCNLCEELAGHTYSLAAARGLLPRHPNCRCVVVPATDRRFAPPVRDEWDPALHPREPKGVPVGGQFAGGEHTSSQWILKTPEQTQAVIDKVAADLGYPPEKIILSVAPPKHESIGGIDGTILASTNVDTGIVSVTHTGERTEQETAGTVAHEIMHARWETVRKSYPSIKEMQDALGLTQTVLHRLERTDGVTGYSRAVFQNAKSWNLPMHETLAEIANLQYIGQADKVGQTWMTLFNKINARYAELQTAGPKPPENPLEPKL